MFQLNETQRQAVNHKEGPMLVLAGPGSGKTMVITRRVMHLIEQEHIPEEQILVITFTKAAAQEMKERFRAMCKTGHKGVNFGTFHAVFFTILKHAYHLSGANIVREEVRYQAMKEIIHRQGLEYEDEKDFILELLSEISLVKGSRIELSNYYSQNCADEVFRRIYQEYARFLEREKLIDFDDMLVLCHELLSQREDILSMWQNRFRYILIDEFQDINLVQYEIVRMLAKPQDNLFIVGDDDQSIYRFRGAKPEIMLNFPVDYPQCQKLTLSSNYRSIRTILEAAGRLIGYNVHRFEKTLKPVREGDEPVIIRQYDTLALQNQGIAQEILKLAGEGVSYHHMAILVRTNLGSGSLLHKLMEYNIPFRMKDNLPNLFDHWITLDLLAYIKLAEGATQRSLYLQIINRPKRYVSRDAFDSPEVDFEEIKAYYEDKNWMLERLDQLEYDLGIISTMTPYAAVNYIRRGIGYEDYLTEYATQRRMKPEELFDILDELQESARGFSTFDQWFLHMEEYREELKRQSLENSEDHIDSIQIVTMHGAKGLEFEAVFIPDANEGITPHKKAVLEADIEEERRLFYVAMTRAISRLYIFWSKERYNKTLARSRFLDEIER